MKKISNLLWGLIFILVGVVFGLNALGISDINIFFDGWWTLFIIVPCFIGLFNDDDKSGNLIGLIISTTMIKMIILIIIIFFLFNFLFIFASIMNTL